MRSRLLVSAAVMAAGLAVASAQNAPRVTGQDERNQARGQHHRTSPGAGFGLKDGMGKGLSDPRNSSQRGERGMATRSESIRPHGGHGDLRPPVKNNDASVLPPAGKSRGQWGRGDRRDGMSGERSTPDHAMGQGHLPSAQDRTRPARRQPALPLAKERGRHDLLRSKTLPDQGMGRAGERDVRGDQDIRGGRDRSRGMALHRDRQQGGGPDANAGQDQIRKVQTALNEHGFAVGDADGRLGKRTKEALIAFQKQRGFPATGKVDRMTLRALLVSGVAPGDGRGSSPPNPAQAPMPVESAPQGAAPATTGQGGAASQPAVPAQPAEGEQPLPDLQMPETGASGRVPAGSPQEDYKDGSDPPGGDQR
jgi:hypothetical protein